MSLEYALVFGLGWLSAGVYRMIRDDVQAMREDRRRNSDAAFDLVCLHGDLVAIVDEFREYRYHRRLYNREDGPIGLDTLQRAFDVCMRASAACNLPPYNFSAGGNVVDNLLDALESYRPLLKAALEESLSQPQGSSSSQSTEKSVQGDA